MEEPWEALDLDDSDISSTFSLRRCTRQSQSHQSPPHSLSSLPSPLPSQQPPQQQPPRSTIPGPAGAIQAAMHRTKNRSFNSSQNEVISTQEFIRRVEEDSGEEFTRDPWILALDFVRRDGVADATPLSAIKKCGNADRFDKVVAIVKSCSPNGLGDMMVTLKDPTDTIGASVHRKVFSVGEFGKSIAVGSVLVLQKVVAFSSSYASSYLNVTRSNVVKVISVDGAVHCFREANALITTPGITDKTSGLISRRTEGIIGDVQQSYNLKGKAITEKLKGKENSAQTASLISSKHIENAANKVSNEHIQIDLVDSSPIALDYIDNYREGGNSFRSIQTGFGRSEVMARNLKDCDSADKQKQVKDFSSAACIIENLDTNLDIQVDSLAGTSSRGLIENLDGIVGCGTNDIQNPSMAENLTNQDRHKEYSQKRKQLTNAVINVSTDAKLDQENKEANGVKKQRPALISRTSVQEWTDEQLGILDIDEF